MKNIHSRLNAALTVCKQVTRLSPNTAYICGGAPRDIFLGRNPKDFDIFVPIMPGQVEATAKRIRNHWAGKFGKLHRNYCAEGYSHMREEVLGAMKSKDGNIDVVLVDAQFGTTPESIVAKFDNSLSMAWLTGNGQIGHTALFAHSVTNNVLIAIPCNVQNDTHLKRVAAKYSDFALIV